MLGCTGRAVPESIYETSQQSIQALRWRSFHQRTCAQHTGIDVTQPRLGFILFATIAVGIAAFLFGRAQVVQPAGDHRSTRQLILHFMLSRLDDPIIVLGDSNVEASTLPRQACGHAIVNAGLNGASTASDLGGWLSSALAGKRAFAIILSVGTNDALTPAPIKRQAFEDRYGTLLLELSKLTDRRFIVEIPPVEVQKRLPPDLHETIMATIQQFRDALPGLATRTGATFLALPEMSAPFTIDGIHLSAAGYRAWDQAVMRGAAFACGGGPI